MGDAGNAAHPRNVLIGHVEGVGIDRGHWIEFAKIVKRLRTSRKFVNIPAEGIFARRDRAKGANIADEFSLFLRTAV